MKQTIAIINAVGEAIARNQVPPEVLWKKIVAGVAVAIIVGLIARGMLKMRKMLLILCVFCLMGCAMTAAKTEDAITLDGWGSGKATFPEGYSIEKGLFSWPQIKVNN